MVFVTTSRAYKRFRDLGLEDDCEKHLKMARLNK